MKRQDHGVALLHWSMSIFFLYVLSTMTRISKTHPSFSIRLVFRYQNDVSPRAIRQQLKTFLNIARYHSFTWLEEVVATMLQIEFGVSTTQVLEEEGEEMSVEEEEERQYYQQQQSSSSQQHKRSRQASSSSSSSSSRQPPRQQEESEEEVVEEEDWQEDEMEMASENDEEEEEEAAFQQRKRSRRRRNEDINMELA